MTNNKFIVISKNESASFSLKTGKPTVYKAQAGERYRVIPGEQSKEKTVKNVVARRSGDDLLLDYADGTQILIEGYFAVCRSDACSITLPSDDSEGVTLTENTPVLAALADGSSLVYAHGEKDALLAIAIHNPSLKLALTALTESPTFGNTDAVGEMGILFGLASGVYLAQNTSSATPQGPLDKVAPNVKSVSLDPNDDGLTDNGVDLRVDFGEGVSAGDTLVTNIFRGKELAQTITTVVTTADLKTGYVVQHVSAATVAVAGSFSSESQIHDAAGNRGNAVNKADPFTNVDGLVHDDYMANAFVFIDRNRNDTFDEGDVGTYTNTSGRFSLTIDPSAGLPIISIGGVDTATGLLNANVLYKAYTGAVDVNNTGLDIVLSPLTTLISEVAEKSKPAGNSVTLDC